MSVVGAAAIAAGASLIGGAMSSKGQELTNETNLKIARETNRMNESLWRAEMAYNDPSNQVARYRSAGLNPALMYGSITPGNAGSAPTMQGATMQNAYEGIAHGISSAGSNFVNTLLSVRMNEANVKKAEADAKFAETRARESLANTGLLSSKTSLTQEQTTTQYFQTAYWQAKSLSEKVGANVAKATETIAIAIEKQKLLNLKGQEKEMYSRIMRNEVQNILDSEKVTSEQFYRALEKQKLELQKKIFKVDSLYKSADLKLRSRDLDIKEYKNAIDAYRLNQDMIRWTNEFLLKKYQQKRHEHEYRWNMFRSLLK